MSRSNSQPERADIYTRITAQIVAAIEAGAGEYRMPWHGSDPSVARPINVASGKAYRGVNRLALWIAAQSACYITPRASGAPIATGRHSAPRCARASAPRV